LPSPEAFRTNATRQLQQGFAAGEMGFGGHCAQRQISKADFSYGSFSTEVSETHPSIGACFIPIVLQN